MYPTGRNILSAQSVTLKDFSGLTLDPGADVEFRWDDGAVRVESFDSVADAKAYLARLGYSPA